MYFWSFRFNVFYLEFSQHRTWNRLSNIQQFFPIEWIEQLPPFHLGYKSVYCCRLSFLFQSIIHSFVCLLCVWACMCHSSSMQDRGQLVGGSSRPPPCGSQDSRSGGQAGWQVPYPVNHLASPGLSHFYECFNSHSLSLSPLTFPISLTPNRHTF